MNNELLQLSKTITVARYRTQLMHLSQEKRELDNTWTVLHPSIRTINKLVSNVFSQANAVQLKRNCIGIQYP